MKQSLQSSRPEGALPTSLSAPSDPSAARPAGRRGLAALTLLLLLQLPWPRWLAPGDGIAAQWARESVFWAMTAVLLLFVLRVERRPLSSLGRWKPDSRATAWAIVGAVAAVAGMAILYLAVFPALGVGEEEQLGTLQSLPTGLLVGIVARAGVFEELLYRGFAIERVTELTGRRWLAVLASLLLFTFAHLDSWGWQHLLVAFWGGAVLTAVYCVRRNLAAAILAHWLIDAVGFSIA